MKTLQSIRNQLAKPYSVPILLLLLSILAYGLFLPWMGFYWDDWPWIWRYHVHGIQGIRNVDIAFRPLAGIVLWVGAKLFGENALGWQFYILLGRWLGGVALWWSLRQIWPNRKDMAIWSSLLFLVYPGFGQQFVSINSSRHIYPLVTFFLSFGFMAKSFQSKTRFWMVTGLAILFSLVTMLTTEYYYGLEFIRGAILWNLNAPKFNNFPKKLTATLKSWLPYLLILLIVFDWRFTISKHVNYNIVLDDQLLANPALTVWAIVTSAFSDLFETTWGAYAKIFVLPNPIIFGVRKTLFLWGLILISALTVFFYPKTKTLERRQSDWNLQAIVIGFGSILIGGLPFWASDLGIKLTFPNDRLTLPLMFGACLVITGSIDWLRKPDWLRRGLLSIIVGLSVGAHFQNAVIYQNDWKTQNAFFEQLTWRLPGLMPGTVILTPQLPFKFDTDNSLTAPLNWVFNPDYPNTQSEVIQFRDIDLRIGGSFASIEEAARIPMVNDGEKIIRGASQALTLFQIPSGCLRILDPKYDRFLPGVPDNIDVAVQLSNMDQIILDDENILTLPAHIFDVSSTKNWCYYFQRADLARQRCDWERVAELGDIAFALDDSPNHASERVPFIEAYAHLGEWETARQLTQEAIKINKLMGPMLCDTWARIDADIESSPEKKNAIKFVVGNLNCSLD